MPQIGSWPGIAVVVGLLAVLSASDGIAAGQDENASSRGCRTDPECGGYQRCLDGSCAVPPAVLGYEHTNAPTVELVANGASRGRFFVETATNRFAQARGLRHRPSLAAGWGMLFLYPKTIHSPYTMAQMRFPLDIIFIDEGEKVVDIIEHARPRVPVLVSSSPYRYVLELNAGDVRAHGIRVGDEMRLSGVPR